MTDAVDVRLSADPWPFEKSLRITRRDISRAFDVPMTALRTKPVVGPAWLIRRGSARERLDVLLDEIAFGQRCATCAGRLPFEAEPADVCRCGSRW